MGKNKQKFNKSIELFQEKSGDIVRIIRFRNQKDFDDFLYGYKAMRYPGYKWRFCKTRKRWKTTYEVQN
ncbi:MAG: hypothetical protein ACXACC_10470 [Promethearchaeota archaeon]|jgi:hypothetical protein